MLKDNQEKINYIKEVFCQTSENLKMIEEQIEFLDFPRIQIKPEIVKIIQLLMKTCNPKKIVEIGGYIGYSAIAMAEILPKDAVIHTIEKNFEKVEIAKANISICGFADVIKLYHGEAVKILEEIKANGPFDLVLIDANKSQYLEYLDWAEANLKKDGIILTDNILMHDAIFDDSKKNKFSQNNIEKMRKFNQRLSNSEKYLTSFFPVEDGFTISVKLF